jgi:hypothetical protein
MSGKKPDLTPLESRKQLLILESEVNRALLLNEVQEFRGQINKLASHVTGVGSVVAASADLAGALATLGHALAPKREGGEKASWISSIVNGVRAGFSLWRAFRSGEKEK